MAAVLIVLFMVLLPFDSRAAFVSIGIAIVLLYRKRIAATLR